MSTKTISKSIVYALIFLTGMFVYNRIQWFFDNYEFVAPIQKKMISPLPKSETTIIVPYEIPTATLTPSPTVTVTITVAPTVKKRAEAIKKVMNKYKSPGGKHAEYFAELSLEFPILEKYPYLLPAICLKETGCGKVVNYTNNLMSWGIYTDLKCTSEEFCIERAASGIGKRTSFYETFRETGDLAVFLNVYAPPTSNNTELYHEQLISFMNEFKNNE